jgi:nitrogen regulatory protein PII
VFCDKSDLFYEMNVVIVKNGMGSRVLALAKKCGMSGGTILFGKGTARNSILRFFELADITKEIVLVLSCGYSGDAFLRVIYKELSLEKANHGIAFSIPVATVMGTHYCNDREVESPESEGGAMVLYSSIFVITDKGKANQVVAAATDAGARGATIINARGSGIHETSKLFALEIEPEKEIVIILIESEKVQGVCDRINEKVHIDDEGKGILFVQSVNKVYGVTT